jgi:hypothetical protein
VSEGARNARAFPPLESPRENIKLMPITSPSRHRQSLAFSSARSLSGASALERNENYRRGILAQSINRTLLGFCLDVQGTLLSSPRKTLLAVIFIKSPSHAVIYLLPTSSHTGKSFVLRLSGRFESSKGDERRKARQIHLQTVMLGNNAGKQLILWPFDPRRCPGSWSQCISSSASLGHL